MGIVQVRCQKELYFRIVEWFSFIVKPVLSRFYLVYKLYVVWGTYTFVF